MLIVFEGISGSGKSTQISLVARMLRRRGYKAVIFPKKKYKILKKIKEKAEKFPFVSLIRDLLHWIVRETYELALREFIIHYPPSTIILVDRGWGSIIAYSARTLKLGLDDWLKISRLFIKPDITFLFDVDYTHAAERKSYSRILGNKKIFESVRRNYKKLANTCGWIIIDKTLSPDQVTKFILKKIEQKQKAA